jgi:hypothetical protein
MIYQQLSIFVFAMITLLHLSIAATFNCDDSLGYITCNISLNPGNDFYFDNTDDEEQCSNGGVYCAWVGPDDDSNWLIMVSNDGLPTCYATCPFQETCSFDGGCYNWCETQAC